MKTEAARELMMALTPAEEVSKYCFHSSRKTPKQRYVPPQMSSEMWAPTSTSHRRLPFVASVRIIAMEMEI